MSRFKDEFDRYIRHQTDLKEFEKFVVSEIADGRTGTMVDAADAALIRLGQNEISEQEFVEAVEAEIRESETTRMEWEIR